MEGFTLTIIDTTGIQEYIFGSNKLKENIGASYLLMQVSTSWLYQALEQNDASPTEHNYTADYVIEKKPLEDNADQKVEVIYSGGGNIVFLSQDETIAKAVVRALSRTLLVHAPGLEISVAHRTLKAGKSIGGVGGAYNDLLCILNRAKQQRRYSMSQLGLGVTLACRATGLPAVYFDDEEQRHVSADIQAKLGVVELANERLKEYFGDTLQEYTFGTDFDDFGRSRDDSSYIAVIHADGNGMGKRFEGLVAHFGTADQNRTCLDALRALSLAVEKSGKAALYDAIKQLNGSFSTYGDSELDQRMKQFLAGVQQHKKNGNVIFPVRPLVFGGDDLTLVCDGRLGLALAAVYLKEFHKHTTKHFTDPNFLKDANIPDELRKPAYACAGVAVVKTHYPFARAYALSEALCNRAKTALREQKIDASAMDWHFAAAGINADLGELHKRQYLVKQGDLTMRPITVDGRGIDQPWREWNELRGVIEAFVNKDAWRERHNKVVALREALRADDVDRFRRNYKMIPLPELSGGDITLYTTGWKDKRSGYFDAIEALEFYLPIEPVKESAS